MSENKQDSNNKPDSANCCWLSRKINPKILRKVIIGLTGLLLVIFIFGAGVFVGQMKAKFSYRWAENYHNNFGGPRGGFFNDLKRFPAGDFIEGHGIFGEIIQISNSEIVIKGNAGPERVVIINKNTVIEKGRQVVELKDLKAGDTIVVIGSPNDQGQIIGKIIRIFEGISPMGSSTNSKMLDFAPNFIPRGM